MEVILGVIFTAIVLGQWVWRLKGRMGRQEYELEGARGQVREMEEEIGRLREGLGKREEESEELKAQLMEEKLARAELNALRESELRMKEEREAFQREVREQFENTFKALSLESLRSNNESFLELAQKAFEKLQIKSMGDLNQKQEKIEGVIEPIEETLKEFKRKIEELEKNREGAYVGLCEQLKQVAVTQAYLHEQTGNLVKALRSPNVRGQWGELQLKRAVEIAGMVNYVDFFEQVGGEGEGNGGRLRPDMVVKLPNDRNVVIDAKTPLVEYLHAFEAKDNVVKEGHLREHARLVRDHINKLSTKGYWKQFNPSPEFVVLFMPGEAFFSAALEQDPGLIEYGAESKVILATPTTLIALLKVVAYGWRQNFLGQEVKEIAQLGEKLADKLEGVEVHMQALKRSLGRAVGNFENLSQAMEQQVVPVLRKLRGMQKAGEEGVMDRETVLLG